MADRARALQRIAKVQGEMVRLAEWRVAAADRRIAALAEDRARLGDYAASAGALGEALSKAALRSLSLIEHRAAELRRGRAAEQARLDALRRRDHAVTAMAEAAAQTARQAAEAKDLTLTIEAWLAARSSTQD